jgi:hypothetical protein
MMDKSWQLLFNNTVVVPHRQEYTTRKIRSTQIMDEGSAFVVPTRDFLLPLRAKPIELDGFWGKRPSSRFYSGRGEQGYEEP